MPAYCRLSGKTVVFGDAVKAQVVTSATSPTHMIVLSNETEQVVAFVRVGEGDFVTVGAQPTVA